MEVVVDNLETLNIMRNYFYLFSLCFRYPTNEVYEILDTNIDNLKNVCCNHLTLPPIDELQSLYISLFVNNNGFLPVIPYLSCYLDNNYVLYGKSHFEIKKIFNELGICLKEEVKEPEDHIYLILEALGFCLENYINSSKKRYIDLFHKLYRDILLKVFPNFLKAVEYYGKNSFYYFVTKGLKEFLYNIPTKDSGGFYEVK